MESRLTDADGIVSEVESAVLGGGRNPLDLLGSLFNWKKLSFHSYSLLSHESVSNLQKLHRFQVQDFFEQLEQVDRIRDNRSDLLQLAQLPCEEAIMALVEMIRALGWLYIAQMLKSGEVFEVRRVSSFIHGKLPDSYTTWRDIDFLTEDAHIGTWFGWIAWMIQPLIPQTVAAPILTGIIGIGIGFSMLLLHLLIGGTIVPHSESILCIEEILGSSRSIEHRYAPTMGCNNTRPRSLDADLHPSWANCGKIRLG